MTAKTYDLICMGRSSIDLYSNDSSAPFKDIASFSSFVGGCPTNIAVGTRRLGLKSVLLTAVGDDPVAISFSTFSPEKMSNANSSHARMASAAARCCWESNHQTNFHWCFIEKTALISN